jgi:Methyltransferase domain
VSSVERHYEQLLAPVYLWMAGGAEAAFALGQADLAAVLDRGGFAIDLGAGFGMHAIPLARAGWRVLAIDSSPALLDQLSSLAEGLPVDLRRGDLLRFEEHLSTDARADLILCMGDTLTHLADHAAVDALCRLVAARLSSGGRFIATFRDYTHLPAGDARFIPVRADEHRILTCFLEECDGYVQVHDLLHERAHGVWSTRVSSYRKLRLSPEAVRAACVAAGLQKATIEPGPRGMVKLVADA